MRDQEIPLSPTQNVGLGRRDVMGKLTTTRVKSLTKPGRYSHGGGLFLEVKPAEVETGSFEPSAAEGGATSVSGRSNQSISETLVSPRMENLAPNRTRP
jgi:hypothetical protein